MIYSKIVNQFDFFMKKIEKNEYFFLARFNHGLWDKIILFNVNQNINNDSDIKLSAKQYSLGNQGSRKISEQVMVDCFTLLKNFQRLNKNNNMYLAVSHLAFPEEENNLILKNKMRNDKIYKNFIDDQATLYNGTLFKEAIVNNVFQNLIAKIINKNVILVSPNNEEGKKYDEKYWDSNFGKRFGIKNFKHINIHHAKASLEYDEISKKLFNEYIDISKNKLDTVILLKAGPLGPALIYRFYDVFTNAYMIDVGNSFDILIPQINRDWKKYHKEKVIKQEFEIKKMEKI